MCINRYSGSGASISQSDPNAIIDKAGDIAAAAWTESHQKEANRQLQQRGVRLLECASAGSLLPHECVPGMDELVLKYKRKQAKLRGQRDRDRDRKNRDLKDPGY